MEAAGDSECRGDGEPLEVVAAAAATSSDRGKQQWLWPMAQSTASSAGSRTRVASVVFHGPLFEE